MKIRKILCVFAVMGASLVCNAAFAQTDENNQDPGVSPDSSNMEGTTEPTNVEGDAALNSEAATEEGGSSGEVVAPQRVRRYSGYHTGNNVIYDSGPK